MFALLWIIPGLFLGRLDEAPTAAAIPPETSVQPVLGAPAVLPEVEDAGGAAATGNKRAADVPPSKAIATGVVLVDAAVETAGTDAPVPAEPERPSIFSRPLLAMA